MARICHQHCPSGKDRGSYILAVVVVIVFAACSTAVARAASDLVHVAIWTAGGLVLAGVTAAAVVLRRRAGGTGVHVPLQRSRADVLAAAAARVAEVEAAERRALAPPSKVRAEIIASRHEAVR